MPLKITKFIMNYDCLYSETKKIKSIICFDVHLS